MPNRHDHEHDDAPYTAIDGITLVVSDHRRVDELLARLERPGLGKAERQEVVELVVKELSVHAVMEEEVLYPEVRRALANGEEVARRSLHEHRELKEALAEIDAMGPDDDRLAPGLAALAEVVRHHAEEEERDVLGPLREALGEVGVLRLGEALASARRTAPTRPHPHAPQSGPAAAVVGGLNALVDRARDLVRRPGEGVGPG